MYQQGGDSKSAIKLVSATLEQLPKSTSLREILINLDSSAGDQAGAEQQLHKLIELKPEELRYRVSLASLVARKEGPDAAQRVLEEAVSALPKNSDAKLTLITFVATQRSRQDGERVLRGFIDKDPDNLDLRLGLGALFERTGALPEAIAAYQDVVKRNGTDPKALIARDRVAAIEAGRGHAAEARKAVDEALQQSPRDSDALLIRAGLELDGGEPQPAITDLREVMRDRPDSAQVRRLLAQAYRSNGDLALAEDTLRAGLEAAPRDVSLRESLADLLLQTGKADQAIALLEETVTQKPTDANARVALVRAELAKRDFTRAQSAVDDLAKLRPDAPAAPFLSGLIAQAQNHPDAAEADYKRALALEPNAIDALDALTRLQLARGRATEAIARAKSVVEANPHSGAARTLLGQLYIETRAYPQAIAELSEATQLLPKSSTAYRSLAVARLGAGDLAGALTTCEAGLKQLPYDPPLTMSLASIYERQGHVDEAIAQYQALYAHDPRLPVVANNLAMLLVAHRTDAHSLEQAEKLTTAFATSDNGAFLDTYGWVRFKAGDLAAARTSLEHALERAPGSSTVRYHLAMAQLKAGDRADARSNLKKALAGAATFDGAGEARIVLASLSGPSG
jgi:predicted Zn-dependent protease